MPSKIGEHFFLHRVLFFQGKTLERSTFRIQRKYLHPIIISGEHVHKRFFCVPLPAVKANKNIVVYVVHVRFFACYLGSPLARLSYRCGSRQL